MLPGFRFLFAAIVLSMSILVFGLGAAALLRAAHEQFASMPSRPVPPETVFARRNEAMPTLAILRVDAPALEKSADNVPTPTEPPAQPPAVTAAPTEPERIAVLKTEDPPASDAAKPDTVKTEIAKPEIAKSEIAKSEIPAPEAPRPSEPAPAQADAPAAAEQQALVATIEAPPPANPIAPVVVEQTSTPASPDKAADAAATKIDTLKIATLGGPPVSTETESPAKVSSEATAPDKSALKKRQQARREAKRRKIAARARLAQQRPQQAPADAFNQPTITVRNR
jgi:hypothetical protein